MKPLLCSACISIAYMYSYLHAEILQVGLGRETYTVTENSGVNVCVQIKNDAIIQEGRNIIVSLQTRSGSAIADRKLHNDVA